MKQIKQLKRMAERARKAAQNLSDPELKHRQSSPARLSLLRPPLVKSS
jgi:hypothetical protein